MSKHMNETIKGEKSIEHPSVIFTIGPSTCDEKILTTILSQNISYVRFNMSHASHEEHRARLTAVRKVSKELGKDIKVFIDLCGPKIRVTTLSSEPLNISPDMKVRIAHDSSTVQHKSNSFAISYSDLYQQVHPNTKIALDDGKILLSVSSVEDKDIICDVIRGGILINEKGANIIDTDIHINPFTEKDEADALFGIAEGFDAVALSFVKRKEDIIYLKDFLQRHTDKVLPVIAKIETRQALHGIEGILEVVDMIMVARGDLGIELPIEKIPLVQKELIYLAKKQGVPAIVATEMLKSMTKNSFPTRAEITDCIDSLIDGASYIMLSDETTTGQYPVEAVSVMTSVIKEFTDNSKKYELFEKK